MTDFKLRLSDIFRYIVLGAIQATLCYAALGDELLALIPASLENVLTGEPVVTLVIALSIFYLSGFVTQMIIQVFCKGNFMGTGLGEIGTFIRNRPASPANRRKYPHWLYYSRRPDKVLGIYREIMETSDDSDAKTEYLYANNLFQGIAFTLVIFAILDLPATLSVATLLAAAAVAALLCVVGTLSVKHVWATIADQILKWAVPLAIVIAYYLVKAPGDRWPGLLIGAGTLLSLCMASQLTRRHIRRIDVLIKYGNGGQNEDRFIHTLKRNGVPKAFILTRVDDSTLDYYEDQLSSIASQIYPNIKAIALIDRKSRRYESIVGVIERFRKQGLDITHYTSDGSGPAALAYEIRDIFLAYAEEDDVAISLDADDLLANRNAVAIIMGRMARTQADICLITFEFFGDSRLNFSKNYPNEVVKCIASDSTEKGKALTPEALIATGKAHLISTIGWTKCYRAKSLKSYQRLWDKHKATFEKYTKYEDFPDIVALLHPESRICAVGRTTVLFRKHAGSVTTAISPENYDHHITHYLGMAIRLSEEATDLTQESRELIRRKFVPYKFIQYLNIVRKKTGKPEQFSADGKRAEPEYGFENYSPRHFYETFTREVYGGDPVAIEELKQGMTDILKENYLLTQERHTGYYDKDLPDSLHKADPGFADIAAAYGLQ